MSIEIIAAMSNDRVIGHENEMPWGRLPRDLSHFKNITDKQTIVMGYTTLVSVGRELPGRKVLVLTRDPRKLSLFPWCTAVTKKAVLKMAKTERIIIAGGETVYREFLPYATVVHITRIEEWFIGDTFFPKLSLSKWEIEASVFWEKDKDKTPYPLHFETWVRKTERPTTRRRRYGKRA